MTTLREMRKARGWSLKELAKISGVSLTTLLACEKEKRQISQRNYGKLQAAFDGEIPEDLKLRTKNGRQKFEAHPDTPFYQARIARGLTLKEVSKATGVSLYSIRLLEIRLPVRATRNLVALSKFYDIPAEKSLRRGVFPSPLRKLRLERKLSIIDVAKNIAVAKSTIRAIEAGQKTSREILERLAAFYEVNPGVLDPSYTSPGRNSKEDFAKLVTEYRECAGLTRNQLCRLVGLADGGIWQIECGGANSSIETRLKIAEVLHIPESKVLNFDLRRKASGRNAPEPVPPTPEQQAALDKLKFKSLQDRHFAFIYEGQKFQGVKRKQVLKLRDHSGKYLFFTDSGGSSQTFTQQQLRDYKIRPATEQEVHEFENPKW